MTYLVRSNFQAHPFHLVSPSPWPIFTCISLLALTTSGVLTMHGFYLAEEFLCMALLLVILTMSFWFRDVISEATYLGNHTLAVQRGLNMGVGLFIVSEALFFLAIFWTFFHSALSPGTEMGAQWPPKGIDSVNPFELPLLNTVILLSSGFTVTYAHHSIIQGYRSGALYGTVLTVMLALIFTGLQGLEYTASSFTLSDSTYGSCFYFGTGFHGLIDVAPSYLVFLVYLLIYTTSQPALQLTILLPFIKLTANNKTVNLDINFIACLVGFTDNEGNFNLSLKKLKERRKVPMIVRCSHSK